MLDGLNCPVKVLLNRRRAQRRLGPEHLAHRRVCFKVRPANQVNAIRHGCKNAGDDLVSGIVFEAF